MAKELSEEVKAALITAAATLVGAWPEGYKQQLLVDLGKRRERVRSAERGDAIEELTVVMATLFQLTLDEITKVAMKRM